MKRASLAACVLLLGAAVLLVEQRITTRPAEKEADARGESSKSQRSPRSAESAGAVRRLRALLGDGAKPDTTFGAIEAAARKMSDEELQALIEEVWPRGVEGYTACQNSLPKSWIFS